MKSLLTSLALTLALSGVAAADHDLHPAQAQEIAGLSQAVGEELQCAANVLAGRIGGGNDVAVAMVKTIKSMMAYNSRIAHEARKGDGDDVAKNLRALQATQVQLRNWTPHLARSVAPFGGAAQQAAQEVQGHVSALCALTDRMGQALTPAPVVLPTPRPNPRPNPYLDRHDTGHWGRVGHDNRDADRFDPRPGDRFGRDIYSRDLYGRDFSDRDIYGRDPYGRDVYTYGRDRDRVPTPVLPRGRYDDHRHDDHDHGNVRGPLLLPPGTPTGRLDRDDRLDRTSYRYGTTVPTRDWRDNHDRWNVNDRFQPVNNRTLHFGNGRFGVSIDLGGRR